MSKDLASGAMTPEGTVPLICITSFFSCCLGNLLVLFSQTGCYRLHQATPSRPLSAPTYQRPPGLRPSQPPHPRRGGERSQSAAWTPQRVGSATSLHHPPLSLAPSASPLPAPFSQHINLLRVFPAYKDKTRQKPHKNPT